MPSPLTLFTPRLSHFRGILELPPEVLVNIFSQPPFVQVINKSQDIVHNIPALHILALVCKDFARIITSTPLFWSTLTCGMDPNILFSRLQRVGSNASIKFVRSDETRRPLPAVSVHLILCHLHQLEELKIPILRSSLPVLLNKLRGDAPRLKVLEVYVYDGLVSALPLFDHPYLFRGTFPPQLETLKLGGVEIPVSSTLLSSRLTTLCLHSQPRFRSYKNFCSFLLRLQGLERLSLTDCVPLPTPIKAPLHLPRLRHLEIVDKTQTTTSLLKCLDASLESLIVHGPTSRNEIQPLLQAGFRLLQRYIPSESTPTPTHFISDLYINPSRGPCIEIQCIASGRHDPSIRLPIFQASLKIDMASPRLCTTTATIESLPLSEVEVLTLHQDDHVRSADDWWLGVVAQSMPKLWCIALGGANCLAFMRVYAKYMKSLRPGTPYEEMSFARVELIRSRLRDGFSDAHHWKADEDDAAALYWEVCQLRRLHGLPDLFLQVLD
ncbi:hypothetical protein ONZ45_g15601 [Pleurotus djamor]|nr:hypothetical protein ONZ45_g15601 [Pleurotus djamor]